MLKLAQVQDYAHHAEPARPSRAPRPQHLYYAFLSYSHKDKEDADWLHDELERFRVPRSLEGKLTENGVIPKTLKPVFRDRNELAAADDLGEEIREALAASRFLIVLCSPDAAKSRWTNAEIETFKRSHPDGCVLAAILSGEPFASDIPGSEHLECFPPALTHKYDRRGRPTGKRVEPLAADLRDNGDGRRMGFLKLVAGMLGVGLDDLVQREATHRHRRLAWLAAASVVGMAVTSGLAVTAIQARDAARDERREAEGLVAYMLGDLKEKLEPIGRLDALDGVGSRVLAYYSKQDASELSDAALLQRSRALSLMAQVANLRGNLDTAQRLYREAAAGTAEAVERDPNDAQRLFDHAQNIYHFGELARDRGDPKAAETAYREYKRLADQMVAIEPDNLKYRMEVQYARENLGIVLFNQRRYAEAAALFEGALGPIESLAALDPQNSAYQRERATILSWVAQSQWVLGRLDAAIRVRQRQISFLEQQLKGDASDVLVREKLIPARRSLGLLLTQRGNVEGGVEQFTLALDEAHRLMSVEPTNSLWQELAATVRLELASNLISLGRNEEAGREVAAGCGAASALRTKDPSAAGWRTLQSNCFDRRARLALQSGATAQSSAFAERALASSRTEKSGDPVTDRYRVAAEGRLLGDIRQRAGDAEGARSAWSAAIAQLPQNVAERPWEMNERAELLTRVGRAHDARPLTERLAAMGYRSLR